jgi:hypothetical protein
MTPDWTVSGGDFMTMRRRAEDAEREVAELREALGEARRGIVAMLGAGFDSARRTIAQESVDAINATLAGDQP